MNLCLELEEEDRSRLVSSVIKSHPALSFLRTHTDCMSQTYVRAWEGLEAGVARFKAAYIDLGDTEQPLLYYLRADDFREHSLFCSIYDALREDVKLGLYFGNGKDQCCFRIAEAVEEAYKAFVDQRAL